MAKKISNEIERGEPLEEDVKTPVSTPDIVESVQPLKKRRQLTDEQRAKQAENLKRGREALVAKREAAIQERAKMLHDAVVDAPKAKKEDKKLQKILDAVANIPSSNVDWGRNPKNEDEEPEDEIVVVKKRKIPKRTIIVQEEEEHEPPPPPPPTPPVVEKQKRKYTKKPKVDAPKAEAPTPVQVPKQPQILFY